MDPPGSKAAGLTATTSAPPSSRRPSSSPSTPVRRTTTTSSTPPASAPRQSGNQQPHTTGLLSRSKRTPGPSILRQRPSSTSATQHQEGNNDVHHSRNKLLFSWKRTIRSVTLFTVAVVVISYQIKDESKGFPSMRGSTQEAVTGTKSTRGGSLLHKFAPLIFPIDSATGLIAFPEEVTTVIIDVGVSSSDYLFSLERKKDPSIALILIDPLPKSIIPVQQRAAEYSLLEHSPNFDLNPKYTDRVFTLKAAMSTREVVSDFNTEDDDSKNKRIQVNTFTLESLLALIPTTIQSIHLKVDADGNDHMVLRGAGEAIHRFQTVVIACQNLPKSEEQMLLFKGSCRYDEVKEYMCKDRGICNAQSRGHDEAINAMFLPSNEETVDMPEFLLKPPVEFHEWYRSVANSN